MALLELRDVSKIYRNEGAAVVGLENISLRVNTGEFVALLGKSGCGKSTLLNLCGIMDFPTSGEVILDGHVTTAMDDTAVTKTRREKVGFIFQSFQLIHTLSVVENVELPLLLARKSKVRSTALERLAWVEMNEYVGRFPHQLSGGQQQRVAIARALVHDPPLILADEPTGNLDSATGEIVLQLMRRIATEVGSAVIMATHSAESASLADRSVHLRDGRMVEAMVAR